MHETTTIRISKDAYCDLKNMAAAENETLQEIIEKAIEEYKTKKFFEELNNAVLQARNKPELWEEEIEERRLWERTLSDGLEENGNETW